MFQDKPKTCKDCSQEFVFTASEQEFFASKGFTNEPGRCPACRAAKKAQSGYGHGGNRSERQMFEVVCDQCGANTTVPFQPSGDKPVYCRDCFATKRSSY
jgi:CxxC-x17-CxxC domain-containing protein